MMTSKPFYFTNRNDLLDKMRNGDTCDWDIIIVGGGITGAGILREAVRSGFRALLLEQKDFAWGTSSRSSKMVHGGLRYLASGDMKLTRHSLKERERLLREAPGLVDRMDYYFTLRKGVFPGRWIFSTLLWAYDKIAGIKNHRYYNKDQLRKKFDGINPDGLKGACCYTDAVTDDARLVLRVLQESIACGGSALNYTRVSNLLIEDGQVHGVELEDSDNDTVLTIRAPVVINATGAWADSLRNNVNMGKRVRPLRGSHLILPKLRLPVSDVLALFHPKDKRSVFIFPWEGATIVGTTDLDHHDDLNIEASITKQEVDYLLQVVHSEFPQKYISRADIISTYAGIRPVIGSEKSKNPSKERRDHAVWSDKGLVTVSGGKLTTFRLIALDALAAAQVNLPEPQRSVDDHIFKLPIIKPETLSPDDLTWGQRLLGRYGDVAKELLAQASPQERQRICGTAFTLAECRWAIRYEAVEHLDDLLLRRTRLGLLLDNGGEELFDVLQRIFADELGWNKQYWDVELIRYQKIINDYYALHNTGDTNENK
jgi:glycerol-3-phosphate dehydrogenase